MNRDDEVFAQMAARLTDEQKRRVRELVEDPVFRERVFLVRHRIPYDKVVAFTDEERTAWVALVSEQTGESPHKATSS